MRTLTGVAVVLGAFTGAAALHAAMPEAPPHAHGAWSEVFVVREGSGVLETGGTITGVTSHDSATHRSMFVDAEGNPFARTQPPASASPREPTPGDLAGTGIDGGWRLQ